MCVRQRERESTANTSVAFILGFLSAAVLDNTSSSVILKYVLCVCVCLLSEVRTKDWVSVWKGCWGGEKGMMGDGGGTG